MKKNIKNFDFLSWIPQEDKHLIYCPFCGKKLPEVEGKPISIPSAWTGDNPVEYTTTCASTNTKHIIK